jgi:pyridoxal phosphate enzyme (YggS family)
MEPSPMKRKLTENLRRLQDRIHQACARVGRDRKEITLVVVTKYASLDIIRTLVDMGVADIGENRVQALTKRAAMIDEYLGRRARDLSAGAKPRPRWHMIGHLQRNKVKTLLPWVHMIHSVDSLRLAEEINTQAGKLERVIPVMIEVNAGGEGSKFGIAVAAATHFVEQVTTLPHLEVTGLMTMAPLTDDESVIRATFTRTHELFEEIIGERIADRRVFRWLSMGMTNDFEIAIELGATHLRIGTALFEGINLAPDHTSVEETARK